MTTTTTTTPTQPAAFRGPIAPGDVCLCTWPNGQSETVSVLAFRADGRANVRPVDRRNPDPLTVPLSFLTPLTH